MVGATLGNMLDGSHYVKDTATQFKNIVVDNRRYKKQQIKAYKNIATKVLLKSFHVLYFIKAFPSMLYLMYSLRKCSKSVRKSFNKPSFSLNNHLEYTATRNLLDSINEDLLDIKRIYANMDQRKFPLKTLVLLEFSETISVIESYLHSSEDYLKKFNKPVLSKHGNKVLPEAKQWKSRVKAYDFIA